MSKTNKQIVQEFFEQVFVGGNFENVDEYFSENCSSIFMPHVGLGFQADWTQDKVVVEYLVPNGPCKGKLMVGDEIVQIEEDDQIYDSFASIRDGIWGIGPLGTATQMRVIRDGKQIDLELMADRIDWETLPYTLEQHKRDFLSLSKNWKDIQFTIHSMIEEGNTIVCITSTSSTNLNFKRQAVWGIIYVIEVVDGKFKSFWGLADGVVFLRQVGYSFQPPSSE